MNYLKFFKMVKKIVEKHDDKKRILIMPYLGEKGEQIIKSVRKTVKRLLSSNKSVSFFNW